MTEVAATRADMVRRARGGGACSLVMVALTILTSACGSEVAAEKPGPRLGAEIVQTAPRRGAPKSGGGGHQPIERARV